MKFAMSKNPPLNLSVYGSVGNPAGPTTAPIGRAAADDSVAGTGAAAVALDAVVLPVAPPLVEAAGVEEAGAGVELPDGAEVEVDGVVVAAPAPADLPLPADPESPPSSIERKSRSLSPETELSCTSIDAVSA